MIIPAKYHVVRFDKEVLRFLGSNFRLCQDRHSRSSATIYVLFAHHKTETSLDCRFSYLFELRIAHQYPRKLFPFSREEDECQRSTFYTTARDLLPPLKETPSNNRNHRSSSQLLDDVHSFRIIPSPIPKA